MKSMGLMKLGSRTGHEGWPEDKEGGTSQYGDLKTSRIHCEH
jgi:hypothetical protein